MTAMKWLSAFMTATRYIVSDNSNPPPPHHHHQIDRRIRPTSPICSADLLGFCISLICSADLWGFCDFADSFCRLFGASGIPGHLIWRHHSKTCIIYFGTLDNTFSFYIGCSDWHHEVFFAQKDVFVVPWDSLSPTDQQCFNGIPVCICLLVAGFVGACKNNFPIRLTTAGQLWLQIRATGSVAHPPSTQSDGNGKPVCIHPHLLLAGFVCALKTNFLIRTSDKKCKEKIGPGMDPPPYDV